MDEIDRNDLIASAKSGDEAAFRALLEPLKRELHVYCYRMLGSFHDAEDALQDIHLKAWRGLAAYDPQGAFRAWMYTIATNTCLDAVRKRERRVLPQEVGPPVPPGPPTADARADIAWLEPYPDTLLPLPDAAATPETLLALRESIRFAFVRALQLLPARQRAVLVLRDVLDWSANDVAAVLDTTVPAVNSALQRARAIVADADPESTAEQKVQLEQTQAQALARYVAAFETGDVGGLVAMLADDAIMSMPPWAYWQTGRDAIRATFEDVGTWRGQLPGPGRFRVVPVSLNGEPGALGYARMSPNGPYEALSITVFRFDPSATRIAEMIIFAQPELFARWGYPVRID